MQSTDIDSLELVLASDNEVYGGCETYSKQSNIQIEKGVADIEINAFTGLLYDIK